MNILCCCWNHIRNWAMWTYKRLFDRQKLVFSLLASAPTKVEISSLTANMGHTSDTQALNKYMPDEWKSHKVGVKNDQQKYFKRQTWKENQF